MTERLRKCYVDDKLMLFHRWSDESWIVPPSPMVGGHTGGVVRGTYALVENVETGEVIKALPEKVRFEKSASFRTENRRIGHWTGIDGDTCSECGKSPSDIMDADSYYAIGFDVRNLVACPFCGAEMKEETENQDEV